MNRRQKITDESKATVLQRDQAHRRVMRTSIIGDADGIQIETFARLIEQHHRQLHVFILAQHVGFMWAQQQHAFQRQFAKSRGEFISPACGVLQND